MDGRSGGSVAALTIIGVLLCGAAPLHMPPSGTVAHWQADQNHDPQSYVAGDLTLTVSRLRTAKTARAVLQIAERRRLVLRIVGAAGFAFAPADFAVARMDAQADGPGVFFATNTGGAHCCERIDVGEKLGGKWRAIRVGEFDAEAPQRIEDVDGDGIADLVGIDDRFDYAFASHAGSFEPPVVYNLRKGVVWDVSAEPKYRKLFAKDLVEAQRVCTTGDRTQDEVNGACAAFVADAARLGRLEWAWRIMLAHYDRSAKDWPNGCRVEAVDRECPKPQVISYRDFPTALRAFLENSGYIRRPGAPTDVRARARSRPGPDG